jgi:hypothetical protein
MVDVIQVHKVEAVGQGVGQTVYGSRTLSALATLGAVNSPLVDP